jgi:hypothetical protein
MTIYIPVYGKHLIYSFNMIKHYYAYIKELITFGWGRTKAHYWFLACTFLIMYTLGIAIKGNPVLGTLIPLLVSLSVAHIALKIVHHETFDFGTLFEPIKNPLITLKYLVLALLCIAAVVFGLILLVVPGVYLAVRFKFFPFVVLENPHLSLSDLITRSYMVTEGHFWEVFVVLLVLGLINVIAAMTVFGLLVTLPISIFAITHMYTRLKHHTH